MVMVQIRIEKEKNETAVNFLSTSCSSNTLLKNIRDFFYPFVALKFEFSEAIVCLDTFTGEIRQRKTWSMARISCSLIIALSLSGWETGLGNKIKDVNTKLFLNKRCVGKGGFVQET